jgi:hypothetical protein
MDGLAVEIVPAWLVSVMAFLAAWSLWLVRPMPWRIRISIIAPLLYLGVLYLLVQVAPFDQQIRTELIRAGLILVFVPIIANSLLVRRQWRKERGKKRGNV